MRARWEECSLLESRKRLSTPVRQQNPTSSNWQQRDWPTFLAEVAPVAEAAEVGIVVAGSVAQEKERILE